MRQIIACIDTSRSAQGVCQAAAWFGHRLDTSVMALHVLDRADNAAMSDLTGAIGLGAREHLLKELAELDHQRSKLAVEQGQLMLDAACDEIRAAGHDRTEARQLHASLADALEDLSEQTRVVILGRQGKTHEAASDAVGSQLETVVRLSQHPVLVIPQTFTEPRQAVIAYDASPTAKRMLSRLCQSPLLQDLPIRLVMAASQTPEHRDQLQGAQDELQAAGYKCSVDLLDSEPLVALASLTQTPDTLLCMGAFGHSRLREFLIGSTTNETLRRAKCSVLMIR